jgi:hypothetical protein
MAKVNAPEGGPRPESDAVVGEWKSAGERRFLTREAKADALAALDALMKRETTGPNKRERPAPAELCEVAEAPKDSTWHVLRNRIEHSERPHGANWSGANALAAKLLARNLDRITTATPPPEWHARSRRRGPVPHLRVAFPTRVADHRAVILGEISPDLFPVVLIAAKGQDELWWYPQCGPKEESNSVGISKPKHNPLRLGAAFACFAHFGNPNFINHRENAPSYRVRVCAMKREWLEGSNRLNDPDLTKKLEELGLVRQIEVEVERRWPIEAVTISDRETSAPDKKGHASHRIRHRVHKVEKTDCNAPVTIDWLGQQNVYVEVRDGDTDQEIKSGPFSPPVMLTIPGCHEPEARARSRTHDGRRDGAKRVMRLELKQPGLYRVRLYPDRYSFVDPLHEWWLDVKLHPDDESRTAGTVRRSTARELSEATASRRVRGNAPLPR